MKRLIAMALIAGAAGSACAQVNLSIGVNQPGVYGRINIGDVPRPGLVLAEPVIIAPPQRRVERRPIYLYVPPAHQQNWSRYCGRYSACGQPVYFVQDAWVRERYEHEHPGWNHGHGHDRRDDRRDDRRGDRHDDRRDHRHDDRRGPG